MKLKDCPFCGGKAVINTVTNYSNSSEVGFTFNIKCCKCGMHTPVQKNGRISLTLDSNGEFSCLTDERLKLAELWNNRKGSEAET